MPFNRNTTVERLLDTLMCDLAQAEAQINNLFEKGYYMNFELIGNKLMCLQSFEVFDPCELSVDYFHWVDNVGYIYAIRYPKTNLKGIFIAYCEKENSIT